MSYNTQDSPLTTETNSAPNVNSVQLYCLSIGYNMGLSPLLQLVSGSVLCGLLRILIYFHRFGGLLLLGHTLFLSIRG